MKQTPVTNSVEVAERVSFTEKELKALQTATDKQKNGLLAAKLGMKPEMYSAHFGLSFIYQFHVPDELLNKQKHLVVCRVLQHEIFKATHALRVEAARLSGIIDTFEDVTRSATEPTSPENAKGD